MLFTTARSTSSNARAATEVSTSEIFKFFGFSTISATVERRSLEFLSLIKPCFQEGLMHDHGLMGHLAQQLSRHLLIHLHF